MKVFAWLFGWLVPPDDAESNHIYRWRVTVAVFIMTNTLGIAGAVALALGTMPVLFPGFVKADNMENIQSRIAGIQSQQQQQIAQVQQNQLDSKILDTRSRQCGAIKARTLGRGDDDINAVISFATERLQEELDEYQNLTHRRYRLPACEEL